MSVDVCLLICFSHSNQFNSAEYRVTARTRGIEHCSVSTFLRFSLQIVIQSLPSPIQLELAHIQKLIK